MSDGPAVLILIGTVASGKTTIASEIGEALGEQDQPFILVDLDHLGLAFIPDAPDRVMDLRIDNLEAIWPNVRAAGFRYVVLSCAPSTDDLGRIRQVVRDSDVHVVRLITPPDLLEARLRRRDTGRLLTDHLEVMPKLERSLENAKLEDLRVRNDERPPRGVAASIIEQIGWRMDRS